MANVIISEKVANVIRIGGVCYVFKRNTSAPITNPLSDVQGEYEDCLDCEITPTITPTSTATPTATATPTSTPTSTPIP